MLLYLCSIRQALNFLRFSTFSLHAGEPPKPVVSPEHSVVKERNNINVTCSVSKGKKINSITWYKDKKLVPDEMVVTSSFKSILILTNVTHSDAGIYECRVVDFGAGYWFTPATIKVEGMISVLTKRNIACETSVLRRLGRALSGF